MKQLFMYIADLMEELSFILPRKNQITHQQLRNMFGHEIVSIKDSSGNVSTYSIL